jgi:HK97 family phage prohead protease
MKEKFEQGKKAYIQMQVEVKSVDKEMGTLEAVFSTQDIDRHGDIVMQDGWDIKMFTKNPVILNSHNYGDATEVIGKASNVRIEGKKLVGTITFAVKENPKAKVIFDLYAGGFLNAFSVGFIPLEFKQNKDGTTDWYVIVRAELLEVSAVSVPANARALAKAKGIDVEVLQAKQHDDDDTESEGDTDELPESDEVSSTDGDNAPEDGDGSENESQEDDEKAGSDTGDETGDENVPEADREGDEEVKPVKSYKSKVATALVHIEAREKEELRRVSKIIQGILDGDHEGKALDMRVQSQIRKRKINQVIRGLLKIK